MKPILKFYSLLFFALVIAMSCKKDDGPEPVEPTAQETNLALLVGEWDLAQGGVVAKDGADVTSDYQGFAITFTDGGYSTQNAGSLLQAIGTWTWRNDDATAIVLDGTLDVFFGNLTETELTLNFTIVDNGSSAAGIDNLNGIYNFRLNKVE